MEEKSDILLATRTFLNAPETAWKNLLEAVSKRTALSPISIEKDWWLKNMSPCESAGCEITAPRI